MGRLSSARGVSTLAMLLAMAVLAAVAASTIMPAMLEGVSSARTQSTLHELQTIHTAIVGDRTGSFGFYGDVGAFPRSVADLITNPSDNPYPGWRGPYLNVPASALTAGQLLDSYGQPFELYVSVGLDGAAHRVAVISRGPDGLSTNASATPNVASTFTGLAPSDDTYLSQPANVDNVVFPPLSTSGNAQRLEQRPIGSLELPLQNFDANPSVNQSLSGCPSLYTVTLTPQGRAASDARTAVPGIVTGTVPVFRLQQGTWQVRITSPLAAAALFDQPVSIVPNATSAPPLRVGTINSASNGVTGTLAIVNASTTTDLDVYLAGNKNGTSANRNATTNYTVNACTPIQLMVKSTSTIVDQFLVPYGITPFSRVWGATAVTLTVNNRTTASEVRVYVHGNGTVTGPQVAQVALYETGAVTIASGDYVTVKNNAGATVYGPTRLTAATTLNF